MKSDTHSEYDMSFILPRLTGIASLAIYANAADTVGEALERIADAARDLVGAKYAALGIPNSSGGLRHFRFSGVDEETVNQIGALPQGRGLLGAIIRELKPIRLEEMQSDPRFVGFPANHPEMTRFLGVPIIVGQNLYGMLYLTDKISGLPFTEEDQQVIEIVAGYAALVIAGAQLRDRERRLTKMEERERIGMELHDGIIQSLYAVGMYLELMRSSESLRPDDLTQVLRDLDHVITDIRKYIQDLKIHDGALKPLGDCIEDLVQRLHVPSTLEIKVSSEDGEILLPPAIHEAVCQMANEAISNVVRHANATNLNITISKMDSWLRVTFADNGQGFDTIHMNAFPGLGLRNMLKRAELNNGNVQISSQIGAGTRIMLDIPIP